MKNDVPEFVHACMTCQKLKIEHHKSSKLMQPLRFPEWKCDNVSMNFVAGFQKPLKGVIRFGLPWIDYLS